MFGAVLQDDEETPHQILPFLYLGSFKDALDVEKLKKHNISSVLNVAHLDGKDGLPM